MYHRGRSERLAVSRPTSVTHRGMVLVSVTGRYLAVDGRFSSYQRGWFGAQLSTLALALERHRRLTGIRLMVFREAKARGATCYIVIVNDALRCAKAS